MTTPADQPDDLAAWLRAQLDEDERMARETPEESRIWAHRSFIDYSDPDLPMDDHTLWFGDRIVGEVGFGDGEILPDEAEHIARHDPARVLAEVDAKRRILDEHEKALDRRKHHPDDLASAGALLTMVHVVKLLALPYADRPGYREEWRP